jgi:hypothetical protein
MIALPNPFESTPEPVRAVDDGHWPATADPADPVAVNNFAADRTSLAVDEAVASIPCQGAGAAAENYIPELFSAFARRRCMPIISPPLPVSTRQFEPDMDALFDAIVPPEPPIFIRSPSKAFLRALIDLGS